MKKMISMLMILALLLGSVGAFAQDNVLSDIEMEAAEAAEAVENLDEEIQEVFDLYGEIVEITEEYVLLNTADMGYVQVNLSEDTVIEGVDALQIGQTAVVMYNGMMTRSLPPQVTALHIGVYAVSGVIAEVLEDSLVIVQEETGEQIILTLPGAELLGENEELLEDEAIAAEDEAIIEESDAELIEEDEADEAVEEAEEALIEEELFEDEEIEEEAEFAFQVGDKIIAYTTGAMTMSLPPQMNALAIVLDLSEAEEASEEALEDAEGSEEETEAIEAIEEIEESDETVG